MPWSLKVREQMSSMYLQKMDKVRNTTLEVSFQDAMR